MKVKEVDAVPVGLIKPQPNASQNTKNVDLRVSLESAVKAANLNVTERLALNREFYPNGGGFELFPEGDTYEFTCFRNPTQVITDDPFNRLVENIEIPEHVSRIYRKEAISDKDSFQTNLDNALDKLGYAVTLDYLA